MNRRGGQSTGSRLKAVKIDIPNQNYFTEWLIQVVELRKERGEEFAIRFVEESKKKFHLTEPEFEYALSIAKGKKR